MSSAEEHNGLKGYDSYSISLGDELRGERATRGKSLLDVQRDLRLRASYIAAIENSDLGVFPNHGFVAGYVRSYARYLNMDADEVFARFCAESGFDGVNAGLVAKKASPAGRIVSSGPMRVAADDPLLRPLRSPAPDLAPGLMERMSVSAVGSLAVLLLLVGVVGYGGFRVLENIQRVTLAPVEQRPETLTSIGGLQTPDLAAPAQTAATDQLDAAGGLPLVQVSDADLSRLYQPRELDIPVVEQRDGPIVDIDPSRSDLYASGPALPEGFTSASLIEVDPVSDIAPGEPVVREFNGAPMINVVARQPAWVRIYLAEGTVLFEKILETGESYTLPTDVEAPLLRAGNSGSVYLVVNDTAYGPLGTASSVAKNVSLLPDDIMANYAAVTDPPEVIQQLVSALSVETTDQ